MYVPFPAHLIYDHMHKRREEDDEKEAKSHAEYERLRQEYEDYIESRRKAWLKKRGLIGTDNSNYPSELQYNIPSYDMWKAGFKFSHIREKTMTFEDIYEKSSLKEAYNPEDKMDKIRRVLTSGIKGVIKARQLIAEDRFDTDENNYITANFWSRAHDMIEESLDLLWKAEKEINGRIRRQGDRNYYKKD
jgi:hypothetical protein